ncbi:MAG: superoxide dismutase [Ni] [Synoicihabitans sp.]
MQVWIIGGALMKTLSFRITSLLTILGLFFATHSASAHCQVPCGIYDDSARVAAMLEDADTVIKAGNMLAELAGKTDAQSQQQIVRWVNNKESHSQLIISTIADYFLTQRVKSSQSDYVQRLKDHHAVIVAAMKAKQSADVTAGEALKIAVAKLAAYYPHEHKH